MQSNLFSIIADEAIMGILVFQKDDESCIYINRLAREILELSPEQEAKGISIAQLQPTNERAGFRSFSREVLELEGLIRDVLLVKSDGSSLVADVGIRHLKLDKTELILIMFQDVTIQKKLQREIVLKQQEVQNAYQELLQQNKQLKELDIAKDRFIALTTHELRTPMSAIFATAEVLKNQFYDTDQEREDFIVTIYEQATHMLELVNDILDFAKIQAGKMEFYISQQDVNDCLEIQHSNFLPLAEKKEIQLEYNTPSQPMLCYFDNVRIGEVFANIINNALKFTGAKGKVTINIKTLSEEKIRVSITDTGKGIAPEHIDKVFNEFETVGNIKTHEKGTGLGMPISKRIMDQMGGALFLESALGKGTTFHVDIPCIKVLPESEYKERPAQLDDLLSTV